MFYVAPEYRKASTEQLVCLGSSIGSVLIVSLTNNQLVSMTLMVWMNSLKWTVPLTNNLGSMTWMNQYLNSLDFPYQSEQIIGS